MHVTEEQTLLFFREMVPFGHYIPSDSDVLEYLNEVARQQWWYHLCQVRGWDYDDERDILTLDDVGSDRGGLLFRLE